jgi:hypothetical protein
MRYWGSAIKSEHQIELISGGHGEGPSKRKRACLVVSCRLALYLE